MNPALPSDQLPWLAVARRVIASEFADCDGSTRESVSIGLRSIAHPVCQAALLLLWEGEVPKKHGSRAT